MCTAYEIGKRGGTFPDRINGEAAGELLAIAETELLRPTLPAPVILEDGGLQVMRWGFCRPFSNAVVNSREDKLGGGMWRDAMRNRRCLVPASAYYEWSGQVGHKRTHKFESPEGNWLWIAGIWEENKELGRCFSMITTEPKGVAVGIHDRMPAVLSFEEIDGFLGGEVQKFSPNDALLKVSDAVNPLTGRKPTPIQKELF